MNRNRHNSSQPGISVLVVDDEQLARKLICSLVRKDPDFELLGECGDGDEARRQIRRLQPDLVFLDIQMPGLSGVELVQSLPGKSQMPYIVFVTAFDQYAVKAFEMDALDYLLKPIDPGRFKVTATRAKHAIQQNRIGKLGREIAQMAGQFEAHTGNEEAGHMVVRKGDELVNLRLDDIVWVEAASQYVHVHTVDHDYTLAKSLKVFQQDLPPGLFTRVHRSAVINRRFVKRVLKKPNGVHELVLLDGTSVPISRSRKHKVRGLLMECVESRP